MLFIIYLYFKTNRLNIKKMKVGKLIEILQSFPKDVDIVKLSEGRDGDYKEVGFRYIQEIKPDGSISKKLLVQ